MNHCLRRGLLCLLAPLVLGLGGHGARADEHRFETDYILCPAHLRVQRPQELQAARGSKAGELRVSWAVPPHLTAASGSPLDQAVLTVIVDDGASPVVQHRPPADTAVTLHPVPRGRDLEVAVAWTRRGHVISDIQRVHLRTTQIRTWEREPAPDRGDPQVAAEPAVPRLPPVPKTMRKPQFHGDFVYGGLDVGDFYYLGFNHTFDNWYAETDTTYPRQARFRVGLRHNHAPLESGGPRIDPVQAQFDHFRLRVTNDAGTNLLGREPMAAADPVYGTGLPVWSNFYSPRPGYAAMQSGHSIFVLGPAYDDRLGLEAPITHVSNVRQAGRHEAHRDPVLQAIWQADPKPVVGNHVLSFTDLAPWGMVEYPLWGLSAEGTLIPPKHRLFAQTPHAVYDLPPDLLGEGTYTLTAWAENRNNQPISPPAHITFKVEDQHSAEAGSGTFVAFPHDTPRPVWAVPPTFSNPHWSNYMVFIPLFKTRDLPEGYAMRTFGGVTDDDNEYTICSDDELPESIVWINASYWREHKRLIRVKKVGYDVPLRELHGVKKNGELQRIYLCKVENASVTVVDSGCLRYTDTAETLTLYKPGAGNPFQDPKRISCEGPGDADFPDEAEDDEIPLFFGEGSHMLVKQQNVPVRVIDITVLEQEE